MTLLVEQAYRLGEMICTLDRGFTFEVSTTTGEIIAGIPPSHLDLKPDPSGILQLEAGDDVYLIPFGNIVRIKVTWV